MNQEPDRIRPGEKFSQRMAGLARQDTAPELALRRELHRRGLRYRLQVKVPGNRRRKIDIAFTRARLAVYVDGCFWHGCPDHHVRPHTNADWWDWKVGRNRERDSDTNRELDEAGWEVLRFWEHEDPGMAAEKVQRTYQRRRLGSAGRCADAHHDRHQPAPRREGPACAITSPGPVWTALQDWSFPALEK